MNLEQYWAKAPKEDIAQEINEQWRDYHNWLRNTGAASMIQALYDAFYCFDSGGFGVAKSVDGAEVQLKVPHGKSILERIGSLTTQSKLAYQAIANNADASAEIQADFANGLLAYYETDKGMGSFTRRMVMKGLICLDAYVHAPWDFSIGPKIRPNMDTGRNFRAGDQSFDVLTRFDVASHRELEKSPWYIVRQRVQKFKLIAMFPGKKDEILKTSGQSDLNTRIRTPVGTSKNSEYATTDMVDILILYHQDCIELEGGRWTIVCGDEVLQDGQLRYAEMPVVHFSPAKIEETVLGDSPATKILSLQQVIDALYSAIVTNNLQYVRQNIWSPSPVEVHEISKGFANIVSAQKPEALQLVESPKEAYDLIAMLQNQQQLLTGVNDTARGSPEASLKSGVSLATMLAVAIQFVSELQEEYARKAGEIGSIVISNLQIFGAEEMIAEVVGANKKTEIKTFSAENIAGVKKVKCELTNPLAQNIAGRYDLTTQFLNAGAVKDPTKLIEFMKTGQMESFTQGEFDQAIFIKQENEAMMKGEAVFAAITDNHAQHILEHRSLADDLDFRKDPERMRINNDHIQEHIDLYKSMDQDLAAILGLMPLPSQQIPPPGSIPPPPGQSEEDIMPGQEGSGINLPNLPPNMPPQMAEQPMI